MRFDSTVTVQGPLFKGNAGRVFKEGVKNGMQELVEKGEEFIAERARPRDQMPGMFLTMNEAAPGQHSKGHYRRSISTEVKNLTGIIHDGGVVYGPWLEGISSRNQSTRFKGYGIFRRAREFISRNAQNVIDKHVRRVSRKLGGR